MEGNCFGWVDCVVWWIGRVMFVNYGFVVVVGMVGGGGY